MDTIVRKMIVTLALCVCLVRCEPPALSSQYGVPGNFAGPQGGYQQQQQQQQQQQGGYQTGVTNSYGAPLGGDGGGGGHGGHGGHGNGHDEQQDYIDNQPKSYEFGYAVKDAASGNDFGRRETSDGETVRGEYRVQLPDGRTQIVTYTADWRTGFHADVRYEGEAQYPDQYNTGNQAGYNANAQGQNYNNNNNVNNNNNNNQGYNNNGNNFNNNGYDYAGSNNIDTGYNNNAGGNHGGYNNYQANQGYNSASNGGYNYQYPSNSIDGGNSGAGYFGPSAAPPPQQAYGVPFH